MEIKTEAYSDDMTEYPRYDPHDDRPTTGTFFRKLPFYYVHCKVGRTNGKIIFWFSSSLRRVLWVTFPSHRLLLTLTRDWNKSTSFWSLSGIHLDLDLLLSALIYWLRLTHQITVHFLSQPSLFLILIFAILCIYREIDRGKDWSWCHRSSRGWWSKAFTCWRKLLFIYSMWETFYIIHTYLSRCYYQCTSNTKWVSTLPDKQWISSTWQAAQLSVI